MTWRATVLTLFPDMFPGPLGVSLAGKALTSGLWALEARDIRDSATDRHRSVDDTPAGGGPGMVLRADVLADAIDAADAAAGRPKDRPRLLMSPRGRPLNQSWVRVLGPGPGSPIVCGRLPGGRAKNGPETLREGDHAWLLRYWDAKPGKWRGNRALGQPARGAPPMEILG